MRSILGAALAACVATTPALAEDAPPDKSGYTLFNPTPDSALRDFAPDRPGKAHGTTTLDAGRFQIETDFANTTYFPARRPDPTVRAYTFGAPMLKAGVTSFMDVQLVSTGLYNWQSARDVTGRSVAKGFGDTLLGTKVNLFGNDGGDQSMAFLAFAKIPTAARALGNGKPEYTFFLPFTTKLPQDFMLTLEPGYGSLRNSANNGYRGDYTFAANLQHELFVKGLTGGLEIAAEWSAARKDRTKVSLDPMLAYQITKNLQIDAGLYIGLNRATPRYVAYTGFAYRF